MSVIERGSKTGDGSGKGLVVASRRTRSVAPPQLAPQPRARLLPPEVGRGKRERALRRRVWIGVLIVAAVALTGTGGAFWYAGESAGMLTSAQIESAALQKKVAGFSEVKAAKADLTARRAAQMVAGAGDVDWGAYLRGIQATLPSGVTMTNVSIQVAGSEPSTTQATPLPSADTTPLVATLTFTAVSQSVPSIPDWIEALRTAPGFVTARPGALTFDDTKGTYVAAVSMDIGAGALSYKYVPKPKETGK